MPPPSASKTTNRPNWAALKKSHRLDGAGNGKFIEPYRPSNELVDIDLLAHSISNRWMSLPSSPNDARNQGPFDALLEIYSLPFPCTSLECAAVAMLELVPSNAECVLDVTSLVEEGMVYCFDDLAEQAGVVSGAYTPFPQFVERSAVEKAMRDAYQLAALYDDI